MHHFEPIADKQATLPTPQAACNHIVQLYPADSNRLLARNVAQFLLAGLERGDSLVLIADPRNSETFLEALAALGSNVQELGKTGRLIIRDAAETLTLFMEDGRPSADLFRQSVGHMVSELRSRSTSGEVSAYGEMVGLLWTAGFFTAAMALEDLWNELLAPLNSRLFCGYPIDVFGNGFHQCDVEAVLCSHSHMIPIEGNGRLEAALYQALDETLGSAAADIRGRIQFEVKAPWAANLPAEALILWIRKNLCDRAEEIVSMAREYYLSTAPAQGSRL